MRTWPLKATVLPTTFPQRVVASLHMEPNSSYSVMSEAPTDHCCAAVAAGHAGNFWATRTHNSNCQQIKTRSEKSLQMFPGNRNISKWLKLLRWGNSSAGGFFHMKQWFKCLWTDQQRSLWATKTYLTLIEHHKATLKSNRSNIL